MTNGTTQNQEMTVEQAFNTVVALVTTRVQGTMQEMDAAKLALQTLYGVVPKDTKAACACPPEASEEVTENK